jgi:hypothetical protein
MGTFNYMADYINGHNTLVITCRNSKIRNRYQMIHFSMELARKGHNNMDFINTYSLDKISNPNCYKTIIIDAIIFSFFSRPHYNINDLYDLMAKYNGRVILKTLDLHEWTFCMTEEYRRNYICVTEETNDKILMKELFKKCKVTDITFYYYCPQSIYWTEYFADIVKRFYIIPHAIYDEFCTSNSVKTYDILYYGSTNYALYPFRKRLIDICNKLDIRLKIITRKKNAAFGKTLYEEISKAWLTIATYSENYSYLVQRYLEIPAASSVILGNMNKQGYDILGDNYIHVDNSMSDGNIMDIIACALGNKSKLLDMSRKCHDLVKDLTYENYVDKFMSIVDNVDNEFEFDKVSARLELHEL